MAGTSGPLQQANNLTDLLNASTALSNLGGLPTSGGTITGATTVTGLLSTSGGTDTSSTAAASSPVLVSNTPVQISTTQDTMLYLAVQTSAALSVAIGPTSTPANTICPSKSYALSLLSIRMPKGWYVNVTGTIADLTIFAVTC